MEDAAVRDDVAPQRRTVHRSLEGPISARLERQEGGAVDRQEVAGREAQVEDRPSQVLQLDRPAQLQFTLTAGGPELLHRDGIAQEVEASVHVAVAHAQTSVAAPLMTSRNPLSRGASQLPLTSTSVRSNPGFPHIRQGSHQGQVDAVGFGVNEEITGKLPLFDALQRQIDRQPGLDPKDLDPGSPEQQVGVEPVVL